MSMPYGIDAIVAAEAKVSSSHEPVDYLYFGSRKNMFLNGEERILKTTGTCLERCRVIINELLKGPRGDLVRAIPRGTKLRSIFLVEGDTAYIDLSSRVSTGHPGGIRSELITVYSIVNTVVLNVSEIDKVKILIEGKDAETLAGHIDIRFPIKANMMLVR